jgi:hypothetical protein
LSTTDCFLLLIKLIFEDILCEEFYEAF